METTPVTAVPDDMVDRWPETDEARAVADAIMYEGYLLYPYRRSSPKNRVRWQFGVLLPPDWAQAHGLDDTSVAGSAESWWQRTECLVASAASTPPTLRLTVRFLQPQRKDVEELRPDGTYRRVDSLTLGAGLTALSFDEAVPHEFTWTLSQGRPGQRARCQWQRDIEVGGGEEIECLTGRGGEATGRIVRCRRPLSARVHVALVEASSAVAGTAEPDRRLYRLRVQVENTGSGVVVALDAPREQVLPVSLVACHTLMAVRGGEFLSLLDPPVWAAPAARRCVNVHTFPVLAGPPGSGDLVLSSPVLLYDHPRVAPESPGDLHDATEIDEILSLRTLTLTDEEKREARATDARAAEIVDRTDTLPHEAFARLHGTIRSLRPAGTDGGGNRPSGSGGTAKPWWDPGEDRSVSPETDAVVVAGHRIARGSRVRLRPRSQGTDPQDMFLDGRIALVEAVLLDVDGARHLAVTLEEDPAAELNQWYGRYRYFSPDEVEPVLDPATSKENASDEPVGEKGAKA